MQPVNVLVVTPVYVIISSSIFKSPYSLGNPFVEFTTTVESDIDMPVCKDTDPAITSGDRLLRFKY